MTLDGHADNVTSLICWDQYLLSGSLDRTIKVWAMHEGGNMEVIHTHNEEHLSYLTVTILKLHFYTHLLLGPFFLLLMVFYSS